MLRTILTFKNDAGWPCIKTTAIHALITSWLFDFKPTVLEWRGIKLLSTIVWTWSHYGEQCAITITKRVTRWKLMQPELFLCSCSVQVSWHTHLLLSTSCGASLCLSVCLSPPLLLLLLLSKYTQLHYSNYVIIYVLFLAIKTSGFKFKESNLLFHMPLQQASSVFTLGSVPRLPIG